MRSSWHRTKQAALVVGVVALAVLLGTSAVMAAQTHVGPFSAGSTSQLDPGDDQDLVGTIQSVDQTGQTFVLAPEDGSAATTVAFDANTTIEKENGSNPLVVGAHVNIEVIKRSDGSLSATEIELAQNDQDGSAGQGGGDENSGSGENGNGGSGGNGGTGGDSAGGGPSH
jgi:uncharacterized membrane protein YgcG